MIAILQRVSQARVDVVTRTRHATREAAERAALALARDNGWGRA